MEVFAVSDGRSPAPVVASVGAGSARRWPVALAAAVALALLVGWVVARGWAPDGSEAETASPLAQALAGRAEPLRIGVVKAEAVGVGPEVARALDLRLRGALDGTTGLVLLELRDGAPAEAGEAANADAVLVPTIGALGGRHLFNVERIDPTTGRVLSRAYREGASLDAVLATVDDALHEAVATESAGATQEVVRATAKRYAGQFQYCYEMTLKRRPDATGRVELAWTIAPSGRVEDVRIVADTVNEPYLAECLEKKLARWLFPATVQGSGEMTWPFVFRTAESKQVEVGSAPVAPSPR